MGLESGVGEGVFVGWNVGIGVSTVIDFPKLSPFIDTGLNWNMASTMPDDTSKAIEKKSSVFI